MYYSPITMYGGMGGGGNAWMKIMGIGDNQKRKKGKKGDKEDNMLG